MNVLNADLVPAAQAARLLRVLIVDDSRLQRRILSAALRGMPYELLEAESGEEALAICREILPDIIISDWIMPSMSGLELCSSIRREFTEDYVYFIILTSKSHKQELAEALRSGADDFLSKPLSGEELTARISAGERLLKMSRELRDKNRLISSTLARMEEINRRLDHDLAEARRLQMSLAPKSAIRRDGWDITFVLQPSGHVGGDLVGTFPISEGRIGLYLLDVSGHGIASALITARLASWLSGSSPESNIALARTETGMEMLPSDVVCRLLNERFLADYDTGHYFTIILGELELESGRFSFCQAGHPHPLLQTRANRLRYIGGGGPPIGLVEDLNYESSEVLIEEGDRLLIYSDGITECPDESAAMLEEEGLSRFLLDHASKRGSSLLDALLEALTDRIGRHEMADDVSAILIERA